MFANVYRQNRPCRLALAVGFPEAISTTYHQRLTSAVTASPTSKPFATDTKPSSTIPHTQHQPTPLVRRACRPPITIGQLPPPTIFSWINHANRTPDCQLIYHLVLTVVGLINDVVNMSSSVMDTRSSSGSLPCRLSIVLLEHCRGRQPIACTYVVCSANIVCNSGVFEYVRACLSARVV